MNDNEEVLIMCSDTTLRALWLHTAQKLLDLQVIAIVNSSARVRPAPTEQRSFT